MLGSSWRVTFRLAKNIRKWLILHTAFYAMPTFLLHLLLVLTTTLLSFNLPIVPSGDQISHKAGGPHVHAVCMSLMSQQSPQL